MSTDFKTPEKKVAGYGANRSGLGHWVQQKFTAITNLVCTLWFLYALLFHDLGSYEGAVTFFSNPINAAFAGLSVASVFFHAKLGLTMVCEDYISAKCKLTVALVAINIFCYGGAALCIASLIAIL
jgi:succinate dehydrogenase / fumarate reductase, membrane anchor subunit